MLDSALTFCSHGCLKEKTAYGVPAHINGIFLPFPPVSRTVYCLKQSKVLFFPRQGLPTHSPIQKCSSFTKARTLLPILQLSDRGCNIPTSKSFGWNMFLIMITRSCRSLASPSFFSGLQSSCLMKWDNSKRMQQVIIQSFFKYSIKNDSYFPNKARLPTALIWKVRQSNDSAVEHIICKQKALCSISGTCQLKDLR